MNSKAYLQRIAKDFGGLQRNALQEKLEKLVALAKREEHQRPVVITQKHAAILQPPPLAQSQPSEPHISINPHDFIPKNTYDAAMKLIREHNNTGWFHITEVPENIFPDFMLIADLRSEIEFDSDRECQYVRVNNFGRK